MTPFRAAVLDGVRQFGSGASRAATLQLRFLDAARVRAGIPSIFG
jgi:hypothetical protein